MPAAPRVGTSAGARVRVERLVRVVEATELHLKVEQAEPGTRLRAAVLARADSEPCRFGWAPMRVAVTTPAAPADVSEEPELRSGAELVLVFSPELADRISKGVRLDLVTVRDGNEGCIQIPITGAAAKQRWHRQSTVSADVAIGGNYFVGSAGGVVGDLPVTLALGRSFGDLRLYGGIGIGVSFCSERTCPLETRDAGTENERRTRSIGLAVPMFVGAESMPWQLGLFGFGTVLEYSAEYVQLKTFESNRSQLLHGPLIAPRLALTYRDPIAPGLRGGPGNGFLALDFPLGVVHAPLQDTPFAPRVGMRVVGSMPLW